LTSEVARQAIETPDGWFEFAPHNCFACGTLNLDGLGIVHHVEPGRSWTELTLDRRFEGWEGIVHGGIVSTILDEVMAWSLVDADSWGLTARLTVEFKRPVPLGRPIHAEGWITQSRRRVATTAGRIVAAGTGEVLATAEALYIAATDDRKRELKERYGYREPEAAR
jgi:acyl-coenzyme A thioesterase PaaI-like protein